jgi:hypothetical protein
LWRPCIPVFPVVGTAVASVFAVAGAPSLMLFGAPELMCPPAAISATADVVFCCGSRCCGILKPNLDSDQHKLFEVSLPALKLLQILIPDMGWFYL